MKKKFQIFILNSVMLCISVILVAFHYSKNEKQEMNIKEAIDRDFIKLNFIQTAGIDCIEAIVLNKTNTHLKIKLPKGTFLKIVPKRLLLLKVLQSDFIEIFPHSTVEQIIIGKYIKELKK